MPERDQLLGELKAHAENTTKSLSRIEDTIGDLALTSRENFHKLYDKTNALEKEQAAAKGGFKAFKWLATLGGGSGIAAAVKAYFNG